jgi:hypothetical protein
VSDRRFRGWLVGADQPAAELLAAPRDASWFAHSGHGGNHGGGKRHIVSADGGSACRGQPLVLDIAEPARNVEPILRCRRQGCAGRWPVESP